MFDCIICGKCDCKPAAQWWLKVLVESIQGLYCQKTAYLDLLKDLKDNFLELFPQSLLAAENSTTSSQQFSESTRPLSPSSGFVKHVVAECRSQVNTIHLDTIALPSRCYGSFRRVVAGRERSLQIKITLPHQSCATWEILMIILNRLIQLPLVRLLPQSFFNWMIPKCLALCWKLFWFVLLPRLCCRANNVNQRSLGNICCFGLSWSFTHMFIEGLRAVARGLAWASWTVWNVSVLWFYWSNNKGHLLQNCLQDSLHNPFSNIYVRACVYTWHTHDSELLMCPCCGWQNTRQARELAGAAANVTYGWFGCMIPLISDGGCQSAN